MHIFIQHLFQLSRQNRQHALHDHSQIVPERGIFRTGRCLDIGAVLLEPVPAVGMDFHRKRIEVAVGDMILPVKCHEIL